MDGTNIRLAKSCLFSRPIRAAQHSARKVPFGSLLLNSQFKHSAASLIKSNFWRQIIWFLQNFRSYR